MRGALTFYNKTLSLLANNQAMCDLGAMLAVSKKASLVAIQETAASIAAWKHAHHLRGLVLKNVRRPSSTDWVIVVC